MKHLALAPLVLVTLVAQPSGTISDPDAYAVYNAVIPSTELIRSLHASELLIQDLTVASSSESKGCVPSGPGLIGGWQDALTNFTAMNAAPKHLSLQFSLPSLLVPYRLESKETIRGFFTSSHGIRAWEAFHAAYPSAKGYLMLSAVGFDKTHEHAIVYMADGCGSLCGKGEYYFLERTNNRWRALPLDVKNCSWVS